MTIIDPDAAQFTMAELVRVTEIEPGRLQTWLARGKLNIGFQAEKGTGNPRLYSVNDMVRIATIRSFTDLGVPIKVADRLAGFAARRFIQYQAGNATRRNYGISVFKKDGKWEAHDYYGNEGETDTAEDLPLAQIVANIDLIILFVSERISPVVAEKLDIPTRKVGSGNLLEEDK